MQISFILCQRKQTLRTQYVKSQYLHSKAVAIYTSLSTNSFIEANKSSLGEESIYSQWNKWNSSFLNLRNKFGLRNLGFS